MHHLLTTLGGIYELARLAVLIRFNFSGDYWQWREHTAFGRGRPESRIAMLREALEYGRWIYRMRHGG